MARPKGSILRQRAAALREQGWSYSRISAELDVSKSTLSYYFSTDPKSREVRRHLDEQNRLVQGAALGKAATLRHQQHRAMRAARIEAAASGIDVLDATQRRILFLGLYWGEGSKTLRNAVQITNSDAVLMRACADFLRLDCAVPSSSLKARVSLHSDCSEAAAVAYWSTSLAIPEDQISTLIKPESGSNRRLLFGTCRLTVNDTVLRDQVIGWLEGVKRTATSVTTREALEAVS